METFGDLLRRLRKAAGMTQTELALAVGVQISWISNLERNFSANTRSGTARPSEELVDKLARALSADADKLRLAAGFAPSGQPDAIEIDDDLKVLLFFNDDKWSDERRERAIESVKDVLAGIRARMDKEDE